MRWIALSDLEWHSVVGVAICQHLAHIIVGRLEHHTAVTRPIVRDLVFFLVLASLACQLGKVLSKILVHEDQRPIVS